MATVSSLREIFRDDYMDDTEQDEDEDQFVSDAFFLRLLNRAQKEAAQRAKLLWDQSTYSITLAEDDRDYALNAKILQVEKAWYGTSLLPLTKTTPFELDNLTPGWTTTEGEPTSFFIRNRTFYVNALPTSAQDGDTITLGVYRLPLVDLAADGDIPEIEARYHEELLHWVAWRAMSRADVDTFDAQMAQYHLNEFERVFGKAVSAEVWRHQMEEPRKATIRGHAYW